MLLNKSLEGNRDSLKDLEYYAGAGNPEAQFHLAYFYATRKGENELWLYWLKKSAENGYKAAVEILKEEMERERIQKQEIKGSLNNMVLELGIRAFFD